MSNAPAQSAPPSVLGGAKPISEGELARELSPRSPQAAPPTELKGERVPPSSEAPVREKQITKDDGANITLGDDKGNREVEPTMPDFKKKAREMMERKAAGEDTIKPAKKEAISADDAPPPAKVAADAEVPDEHKRVMPHDKPDTARRIKAILAERDTLRAETEKARKELEEAKKAPATPANNEEVDRLKAEYAKTQEDLLRYRRRYDLDNDPEFATKYREPVKQAEKVIEDTLKKYNFSEGTLKTIAESGGFGAFSTSQKNFTVQEADPENPGKFRPVIRTAAELSREWLNSLPVADAEAIRATLGKQSLLRTEETAAIQKAQDEAKTYFETQTKAQRDQQEQAKSAHEKNMKEYADWLNKAESETEFLKDKAPPEGATEAQKKAVEEHNEFNAQLRARLKKDPTNAVEYGQLKLEAAEAHHLRRTLGEKDSRIAELEAALQKARGAMRTTPKSGSLLRESSAPAKEELKDPTDFKGGLRASLARVTGDDEA
jgi:hypothetical protein